MNHWRIAIIGSHGLGDEARIVCWRLESAWNIQPGARFDIVGIDRLEAPVSDADDAIVLLANARESADAPGTARPSPAASSSTRASWSTTALQTGRSSARGSTGCCTGSAR